MDEGIARLHMALQSMGNRLGVDLGLDEEGECSFEYQGDILIEIKTIQGSQYVVSGQLQRDVEGTPELFESLNRLNRFGEVTLGHPIVWNEETRSLILWTTRSQSRVSPEVIQDLVERLLETILDLRPHLSEILAKPESPWEDFRRGPFPFHFA